MSAVIHKLDPQTEDRDYEEAKRLARHPDAAKRRRVAAERRTRPELLYFLATDQSAEVRSAIAANDGTPPQADRLLAEDRDEAVRGELARKVARLLPGLPEGGQVEARRRVVEIVEILARDEAVRVRQVVAETLKDVAQAPHDVIKQLARDAEVVVASPVLRFSPLLSDQDLLEIIAARPASGALAAIAGRADLGGPIADAIVAGDDVGAVTALLGNPSAQIREETLDLIVERAPKQTAWHKPLVERPTLPARAAKRIAGFLAEALLSRLAQREDLPAEVRAQVKQEVDRRLAAPAESPAASAAKAEEGETAEEKVRRLKVEGKLDVEAVATALEANQRSFVKAALAELSGVRLAIVDKIMAAHSPKAVTALAWKAGLEPRMATQLQLRVGGISPRQLLSARGGTGWPLTPEEMDWHIEFFAG